MVLDGFVYDPDTSAGKIIARLTKGGFRWVTEKVQPAPGNMKVNTPADAIAIRGTDFELSVAADKSGYIKLFHGQLEITVNKTGKLERRIFFGTATDKMLLHSKRGNLDTQAIIAELEAQRDRLDGAIVALRGGHSGRRLVVRATNGRKRHLTAAQRKRIGEAMKKRWAERKKKSA